MEDRLRKFARVVETGSFTRAAHELHISQPALSNAVHKLERELKSELLVRPYGKHAVPTEAGRAAYQCAKDMGVQIENLALRLQTLKHAKPDVSIGMIDSIAYGLFVRGNYLAALEREVHVSLSVNNSRHLLRALEQGQLDIALIAAPGRRIAPSLQLTPLGSEPLVLVTHPEYAAAAKLALSGGELTDFISYDQQSNTSRIIREHFAAKGITLRPVFYSTSPEVILHMVRSGRGAAVLPRLMVQADLQNGELAEIAGSLARPIVAVERRGKTLPQPIKELCSEVRRILKNSS